MGIKSKNKKNISLPFEVIPTLFLSTVLLIISPFTLRPFYDEIRLTFNWKDNFEVFQNIANDCKVAFVPPSQDISVESVLQYGQLNSKQHGVPFRTEPGFKSVPENHSTYVSCKFTVQNSSKLISPVLYFGPVWGQTSIFINGKVRRSFPAFSTISLSVEESELQGTVTLEIISLNAQKAAGPASLIPMVLLPSETDMRIIDRDLNYFRTEKTLVPLGIAGTMMTLFLCVWIYGIRYRDVYWMTVAAAAAAGSAALTLDPVRDAPIWRFRVNYAIDALGWASFCIAIYTFLRKSAKQTTLILIAISVTAIYMSQLLIPKDIYKSWIGNYQIRDGIVIGIILLIFAKVSSNISPDIPQRRHIQRLTLTYLLIVVGIFLILDGTFGPRLGISAMNITRTALIGAFGTFMIIDLVVFQRGYFEEKSLKEEEEKRRSALEDRMELGFSIQKLLMPNDFTKEYGPFKIHVFYECAEKMAGDWFYWKEAQNECRVVCGDVVGKGPEAAIAATSILTICNNFASVEPTMEAFLKKLNSTVAELFRKSSVSTAGGAALTQSGKATIYNHGFSGWMIIRDSKVEMIAQRGPPLGPDPDAKWEGFEIDMKKGDRLIIFSDGVAEGPRALKKVSAAIQSNYDVSLPNLAQIILETGKFSVIDDDRTLLIIEKTS